MKFAAKSAVAALATSMSMLTAGQALALDHLTVAYFLEWPMPFQFARHNGIYEQELGVTIDWRAFETGTAMSAAMASGDVQMSISQGVPPFVVATSAGQDLQVVDVAVSYSNNDNCVVRSDLEIDARKASDIVSWVDTTLPLQPLVVEIARSIAPDSTPRTAEQLVEHFSWDVIRAHRENITVTVE